MSSRLNFEVAKIIPWKAYIALLRLIFIGRGESMSTLMEQFKCITVKIKSLKYVSTFLMLTSKTSLFHKILYNWETFKAEKKKLHCLSQAGLEQFPHLKAWLIAWKVKLKCTSHSFADLSLLSGFPYAYVTFWGNLLQGRIKQQGTRQKSKN